MRTPVTHAATRRARGYLLMEAMVGGAMASVVLMGMLSLVAVSRAKNVAAARDITANQLVTEAMEQTRALAFPQAGSGPTAIQAAGGVYTRTIAVTTPADCPETRANPGGGAAFSINCRNVTVTVTYTSLTTVRTASSSMRTYP